MQVQNYIFKVIRSFSLIYTHEAISCFHLTEKSWLRKKIDQ